AHLKTCPFQHVQCTRSSCSELVRRRDLSDHLTNKCKHREVKCKYCQKDTTLAQLQTHKANECPYSLIASPKTCGAHVHKPELSALEFHLKSHLQTILRGDRQQSTLALNMTIRPSACGAVHVPALQLHRSLCRPDTGARFDVVHAGQLYSHRRPAPGRPVSGLSNRLFSDHPEDIRHVRLKPAGTTEQIQRTVAHC
ncbi:hypothetical protein scyTo_0020027, partial [Scyliorhinus torazame]|nr:hypothetical protein [Scyliorhinus torazame]